MNLKKSLIAVAACLALAACDNHDELQKSEPGYFKISQVQSPSANGRQKTSVQTGPSASFDLGTIKASKEFFFLLENGGDNPIFDIELTTDNAAVSVSPKKITSLNSSETSNVIPLVSIGFIHGTQLNGVGFTDVLPMGSNSATLTVTGKTVIDGDTISLRTQIALSAFAELMDIQLFDDQADVDLTDPSTVVFGPPDYTPVYYLSTKNVRIKNTGNVNIHIIAPLGLYIGSGIIDDFVIAPGEIHAINFADREVDSAIILDGNGTIANRNRISIGADGKGHLYLLKQF